MFPTIDWTLSLAAILSLVVSIITLYLSHLRGPNVHLAIPEKPYPCHGLRLDTGLDIVTVVTRFLVVNTGNSPGVLFTFRLDPNDNAIGYYRLDPSPEISLPLSLPSGGGWQVTADIQIKVDEAFRERLAKPGYSLRMRAHYLGSSGLLAKKRAGVGISIDLDPLRASLPKKAV